MPGKIAKKPSRRKKLYLLELAEKYSLIKLRTRGVEEIDSRFTAFADRQPPPKIKKKKIKKKFHAPSFLRLFMEGDIEID